MKPEILKQRQDAEYFTDELCHITELSNGAHDEALSIAKARVEPGVTTRWHRLKDTAERYLVLEGTGLVEVGHLPPQAVGPNDAVVIPAGCRQRITNAGSSDLVFLALCTPRFRAENYEEL